MITLEENMKTSEILIKAKALIDTPEKLASGALARNIDGYRIDPSSPDAVCFDPIGAVYNTLSQITDGHTILDTVKVEKVYQFLKQVLKYIYDTNFRSFSEFSDANTHEKVMETLDIAIEIAQSEED